MFYSIVESTIIIVFFSVCYDFSFAFALAHGHPLGTEDLLSLNLTDNKQVLTANHTIQVKTVRTYLIIGYIILGFIVLCVCYTNKKSAKYKTIQCSDDN